MSAPQAASAFTTTQKGSADLGSLLIEVPPADQQYEIKQQRTDSYDGYTGDSSDSAASLVPSTGPSTNPIDGRLLLNSPSGNLRLYQPAVRKEHAPNQGARYTQNRSQGARPNRGPTGSRPAAEQKSKSRWAEPAGLVTTRMAKQNLKKQKKEEEMNKLFHDAGQEENYPTTVSV